MPHNHFGHLQEYEDLGFINLIKSFVKIVDLHMDPKLVENQKETDKRGRV
jgi:hypothetical protein